MQRPPPSTPRRGLTRTLMLALAGTVLFVVGYLTGSRYMNPYADPSPLVRLPDPPPLGEFELRDAGDRPFGPADLRGQWQVVIPYRADRRECRERVRRGIRLRNGLAGRPRLQKRLRLLFIRTTGGTEEAGALAVPDGHRAIAVLHGDPAETERLLRRLGMTDPGQRLEPCRTEAPYVVIDDDGRLRALVPAGLAPETAADALAELMQD